MPGGEAWSGMSRVGPKFRPREVPGVTGSGVGSWDEGKGAALAFNVGYGWS